MLSATFDYEVRWQFKALDQNTWAEKEILINGLHQIVQRENERQAAMAGLMTKQLPQPGVEKHLGNSGVDLERQLTRRSPVERRLGGEDRAGNSYLQNPACKAR